MPGGIAEIIDFMPLPVGDENRDNSICRWIMVREGRVNMVETLVLRSGYGKIPPENKSQKGKLISFSWKSSPQKEGFVYRSNYKVYLNQESGVSNRYELHAGDEVLMELIFLDDLENLDGQNSNPVPVQRSVVNAFHRTLEAWKNWSAKIKYEGDHQELVTRSALTLKGLIFTPTGAIVAAPTTSLPEVLGGERNWDYRYAWLRDSVFIVNAFNKLKLTEEAKGFFNWALKTIDIYDPWR